MKQSIVRDAFRKLTGILLFIQPNKLNFALLATPILEVGIRKEINRCQRDFENTYYAKLNSIHNLCFSNGRSEPMTHLETMRKITIVIDEYLDTLDKYTVGVLNLQLIINTLLTIAESAQEMNDYKLSKLT